MLSQLLFELSRVPWWALWFLVNLAGAFVVLAVLSDDIRARTRVRHAVLIGVLLVIAAAVGILIAVAFALVHAIEKRAWHSLAGSSRPTRSIH